MPTTSSHGLSFTGLPDGLTNVKVAKSAPEVSARKVNASTLDIEDGGFHVYVDAPLIDAGPGADPETGVSTTISVSFLTATPPSVGDTASVTTPLGTASFVCTKADIDYAVGELVKGTAEYSSIP